MSLLANKVAFRYHLASTGWDEVRGGERSQYLEAVWRLYAASYAKIGMHLPNPQAMFKYDLWMVLGGVEDLKAFVTWTTEPAGIKLGLLGTDGSSEGKSGVKSFVPATLNHSPYFSEVSHAVEKMCAGVDVVCAVYVGDLIHKTVEVSPDGIHYKRNLAGVGLVEKKLVGHPKGAPTTNASNPHCPLPGEEKTAKVVSDRVASDDDHDAAGHSACQLDLDD